jgi:dethiobiotin synthetase
VQSGAALDDPEADSNRLARFGDTGQRGQDIVTVTLPDPLAPWVAAERIGQPIDFAALVIEGKKRMANAPFLIVEGAGGAAVPLTSEKLVIDLAKELQLPLLIVARAGLGTVNHTLLTLHYASALGLRVTGIILNGGADQDPAVMENKKMIELYGQTPVLGIMPWLPDAEISENRSARELWIHMIKEKIVKGL